LQTLSDFGPNSSDWT